MSGGGGRGRRWVVFCVRRAAWAWSGGGRVSVGEAREALGGALCEEGSWGMEWRRARECGRGEGGAVWRFVWGSVNLMLGHGVEEEA